jgi:hypothetical protein
MSCSRAPNSARISSLASRLRSRAASAACRSQQRRYVTAVLDLRASAMATSISSRQIVAMMIGCSESPCTSPIAATIWPSRCNVAELDAQRHAGVRDLRPDPGDDALRAHQPGGNDRLEQVLGHLGVDRGHAGPLASTTPASNRPGRR